MKRKGWFIPILVFFICTWLLIVYQKSTSEPYLAQTSNLAQLPWDKESTEIKKVVFSSQSSVITAERIQNDWVLTEPLEVMADATYVYNVISRFVSPGLIHTVESEVEDPTAFGIYEYSPSISLYDAYNTEYQLIAGDAADETTYYAYSPLTKCIYTIKKEIFDYVSTDLALWRNKDYLGFSKQQPTKIVLSQKGVLHTLLPSPNQQNYTSDTLSHEQITNIMSFLSSSKVVNFIMDQAPENIISSYGFNKPDFIFTLYQASGETQSFAFKLSEDSLAYYVLDQTSHNIYKVPFFKL